MWKRKQNYEDTFREVKQKRGVTNPNLGFVCQVDLTPVTPAFKLIDRAFIHSNTKCFSLSQNKEDGKPKEMRFLLEDSCLKCSITKISKKACGTKVLTQTETKFSPVLLACEILCEFETAKFFNSAFAEFVALVMLSRPHVPSCLDDMAEDCNQLFNNP